LLTMLVWLGGARSRIAKRAAPGADGPRREDDLARPDGLSLSFFFFFFFARARVPHLGRPPGTQGAHERG